MNLTNRILEHPLAYRIWQIPFAEAKLQPLLAENDLVRVRRVLDVGCGPGTNARHFHHAQYLGIDLNDRYIEFARRHYRGEFQAIDVTRHNLEGEYDFILVNSVLHHLDDISAHSLLKRLGSLLTADGQVHILDLVLPDQRSIARILARWDRGEFPRRVGHWKELFGAYFEPVLFKPFPLRAFGTTLWNMVYFKGGAQSS